MRRSAFSFKKFSCYLTSLWLTNCATPAGPNDVTTPDGKPGPAAPIAPPPGASTPAKDAQAANSLLAQMPEGADEMTIPVESAPGADASSSLEQRRRQFYSQQTDKEIVGAEHSTDDRHAKSLGQLDKQLGVEPEEKPGQAPSFTLGTEYIKDLFKAQKFEEALIEVNEMLRWYPKSAQLLMMKGTLHQRLSQIDLALTAYQRAFEYEPSRKLKAQIDYVQRLVQEREDLRKQREGIVSPGGGAEVRVIPQGNRGGEE